MGYLRNDTVTTYSSGITISEVAGYGNPASDWDGNGSVNSTTDEFVELTNTSGDSIDISGWFVCDNSQMYQFPSNTILGPGKKALVFHRSSNFSGGTIASPVSLQSGPSTFNTGDGNFAFVWGSGGISNSGDGIGLRNKASRYIQVRFNSISPASALTTGASQGANNQSGNPSSTSTSSYIRNSATDFTS
ncbi:MAG: lamin tail domain-containing protein, partial [Bacteroidetes bacterium]|nr:lamin tail domain-containing protein [Bacteroidota bacterium]